MSSRSIPRDMEPMGSPRPKLDPAEFRRQARYMALAGLLMDALVAAVLLAFQPFSQDILFVLVAGLIGAGLFLTYLFGVMFPRNYEKNYERLYGPRFG